MINKKLRTWKTGGKPNRHYSTNKPFSAAPVDDILKHIANRLPEIKKLAKVNLIVSKWNTQALAKYKSAKQVDVTMLLVEAFKPNARQKKSAIGIQKRNPIPLEKMKNNKH